jgi:hypothetical protein
MDALTILSGNTHGLRVFAVDLLKDEVLRIHGQPELLATLLGVAKLDANQIALFHTDDLEGVGLVDYLLDGGGVTEAQLEPDRLTLAAYRGYVLTLRDAAFPARPVTLNPDPRLRLLGTYAEEVAPVRFEDLPDAAAAGTITAKPAKSDARIGGMVATFVLLFLFALTGLMIWIAG